MFGGLSRDQCLGFEEKALPLPLSHSLARHRGEKKRAGDAHLHSGIHQSGMLSLKSELAIRFHLGAGHIGVHLTDRLILGRAKC